METATKERLTGALLVVLALVIVVPELLSGKGDVRRAAPPAQNPEDGAPLQTYDIPLDGSSTLPAMPRETPAAAAAEIAAVPPPVTNVEAPEVAQPVTPPVAGPPPAASTEKSSGKPLDKPAVVASAPPAAPKPAAASGQARPVEQPKTASPAPSGKWWVQIGSFASRDNAQQLAQKLRAGGFTIDVAQMRSNGKELYRVRAGPVADRPAAVALQARLEAAGQKKSSLVAP